MANCFYKHLHQWRVMLPVQRTQSAEWCSGRWCRGCWRRSGQSSKRTARRNKMWSRIWSVGEETRAVTSRSVVLKDKHTGSWKSHKQTNLHGEDDHRETHNRCDSHCHDHRLCIMEAGDYSHHVGHAESQNGLKQEKIGKIIRTAAHICMESKYKTIAGAVWSSNLGFGATKQSKLSFLPPTSWLRKVLPKPPGSRGVCDEHFHSSWWRRLTRKTHSRTKGTSKGSSWQIPWLHPRRWKRPQTQTSPAAERLTPSKPGREREALGSRHKTSGQDLLVILKLYVW